MTLTNFLLSTLPIRYNRLLALQVRSLDKPRDYTIGPECKFVTDYDDILKDSSINTVVEVSLESNFKILLLYTGIVLCIR